MKGGKQKIQSLIYGGGSWLNRHNSVRIAVVIVSIIFTIGSLLISNRLVKQMAHEERQQMEIWAQATQAIVSGGQAETLNLMTHIIEMNETIPVILTDEMGRIRSYKNIELPRKNPEKYLYNKLKEFGEAYPPIVIYGREIEYIYYSDSNFLRQLLLFPYIQLFVFIIVLAISILAISSLRRADQNKIWEGLSRETAHQLGTPISSLMAWRELLQNSEIDPMIPHEMGKDIERLEIIANRFQKIGSLPNLIPINLASMLSRSVSYMQPRISSQVKLYLKDNEEANASLVMLSDVLFAWVIENLIKNAVDAMQGVGTISVSYSIKGEEMCIDIKDSGKGIKKSQFEEVFRPGYSTRQRGWGLGLSLAKRIIEDYHKGRIFVRKSELGKGTTFRILLPIVTENKLNQ